MNTRMIVSLGLSALAMGGSLAGCTAPGRRIASAGTRDAAVEARSAAQRARKALAKGDAVQAVERAELAVALVPGDAAYRSVLGQAYLKAGRFGSARSALADALALGSGDGSTALDLALAQVAVGDWQAARATLAAHAAVIPAGDRGLAMALAGDPVGGATVLTQFVGAGHATPRDRQNLALALALAGQWQGARIVAAADMAPADVDRRMEQWADFARPRAASDQVAALLGVHPAADPGQPAALARAVPVPPAPVGEAVVVAETPAPVASSAEEPVTQPVPNALPAPPAAARAVKVAAARPVRRDHGSWFVQVGAFRNAAVARDGWLRATRRMPGLAGRIPTNARFEANGTVLHRLAFGGFARGEADAVCRRYRAAGGACFVRAGAGDRVADWVPRPVRLASR